jgi:hypothetical protein
MRAESLMQAVAGGEVPGVFPVMLKEAVPEVMEEDSMVEGVVKGKPLQSSGDHRLLLAVSCENRDQH